MVGEKEERPAQANPSDSSSPKHRDAATVSAKPVGANARYPNKGDLRLLHNLNAVNLHVACEYLGIGRRGLQKAVKAGKLDVIGEGQNRKITVASLRRYLPPSDFAN
jgi:hypothetical protein